MVASKGSMLVLPSDKRCRAAQWWTGAPPSQALTRAFRWTRTKSARSMHNRPKFNLCLLARRPVPRQERSGLQTHHPLRSLHARSNGRSEEIASRHYDQLKLLRVPAIDDIGYAVLSIQIVTPSYSTCRAHAPRCSTPTLQRFLNALKNVKDVIKFSMLLQYSVVCKCIQEKLRKNAWFTLLMLVTFYWYAT